MKELSSFFLFGDSDTNDGYCLYRNRESWELSGDATSDKETFFAFFDCYNILLKSIELFL